MKKAIFVILGCVIASCLFLILLQYYNQPECYLIEQGSRCGFGYWNKYYDNCWWELKLKQCCKGDDYLLKGVYGDKTCWYIMEGQPDLNTQHQTKKN